MTLNEEMRRKENKISLVIKLMVIGISKDCHFPSKSRIFCHSVCKNFTMKMQELATEDVQNSTFSAGPNNWSKGISLHVTIFTADRSWIGEESDCLNFGGGETMYTSVLNSD